MGLNEPYLCHTRPPPGGGPAPMLRVQHGARRMGPPTAAVTIVTLPPYILQHGTVLFYVQTPQLLRVRCSLQTQCVGILFILATSTMSASAMALGCVARAGECSTSGACRIHVPGISLTRAAYRRVTGRRNSLVRATGGLSYKSAGVDIDAGNELVRRIQKLNPSIGGFSGMVPFGKPMLMVCARGSCGRLCSRMGGRWAQSWDG